MPSGSIAMATYACSPVGNACGLCKAVVGDAMDLRMGAATMLCHPSVLPRFDGIVPAGGSRGGLLPGRLRRVRP